ncbi:glycosyltransferase [Neptuniibacter halophilus]|uniref:glycosyltransferase n=1 Tax=Neptuniibacter halophilus TaxID=651666 RepID=UPI00257339B6|nr:glycosyltransferase [Neptuniibacter halophilus]
MGTIGMKHLTPNIITLIATLPEREGLLKRAWLSVCAQSSLPCACVIVVDDDSSNTEYIPKLSTSSFPVHTLKNTESSGAASSWNMGIHFIEQHWPDSYIAILDDDDTWDTNHLALCFDQANRNDWPDVVISGLRVICNGEIQNREPLNQLTLQDFLIGNPGWQGSNTFIQLSTLITAGCFTSRLTSCNDRDLAIRVCSIEGVRFAFTESHTANWTLNTNQQALSTRFSETKLDGLGHFYHLHNHLMTDEIKHLFFMRASTLFGWSEREIKKRAKEWQDAYKSPSSN